MILDIIPRTLLPWRITDESIFHDLCCSWIYNIVVFIYDGFNMIEEYEELRNTPEESYHKKLGKMIEEVKAETKWRDIFKIVEEAQKRLNGKEI